MRPKFLFDVNANSKAADGLRRRDPSVDIEMAQKAGLAKATDSDLLRYAATAGRILLSHDTRTMPGTFARLAGGDFRCAGLILAPQHMAVGKIIEDLSIIYSASEAEEWINRQVWLPL